MFSDVLAQAKKRAAQQSTKIPKADSRILATMAEVGNSNIILDTNQREHRLGQETLTEKEYRLLKKTLKSIRTTAG
jgi:hypothetical protein